MMSVVRQLWALKRVLTVIGLIALLPLVVSEHREARCAYVVLIMAVLWLTEAIPIPATALFPVFLFPMCDVLDAKTVSSSYINDTSMLFLGGLILAVAVEEWGLHRRVAIGVLRIMGSDPKFIMLGLMLPTWFLSMWISNTATASMMIPIANAVAVQMGSVSKENKEGNTQTNGSVPERNTTSFSQPTETYTYIGDPTQVRPTDVQIENALNTEEELGMTDNPDNAINMQPYTEATQPARPPSPRADSGEMEGTAVSIEDYNHSLLCKGLSLCIAYGCNIGGIATLTGTPPNLVFKGQADKLFNERYENLSLPAEGSGVTYANWMAMALPMSAIVLVLGWILLMGLFLRGNICQKISEEQKKGVKRVVMDEWKSLGYLTMAEIEILVLFVFLAIMWLSRDPKETPGWATWFHPGYVTDASAVMIIAALLFILPARIPRVFCLRREHDKESPYYVPLLTWKQVHTKLPWGVIVLLGGGFALARACRDSGLSEWLGCKLEGLRTLDTWVLNLILCLIVAAATEVTSNTATSTLLMPIMFEIAIKVGVNPLYFMASAAIATSFAFMLPVATPPNAIVFSYGHLRVFEMAIAGFFMNGISVLVLTLCVNTWGAAIFDFFDVPPIFQNMQNVTSTA